MQYDKTKDKLIWNRKIGDEGPYAHIISVWIYNEGEPKIQINKVHFNEYGFRFLKIGRLNVESSKQIMKMINEALKFILEYDGEKIDVEVDFQIKSE